MAKRLAAQAAKEENKTRVISEKKSRLHPYTKLTDAQLKTKVKAGDKRAKAILDIRTGK